MLALSKELQDSFKVESESREIVAKGTFTTVVKICIINDSQVIQEGIVAAVKNVAGVKKIITTSKNEFLDNHMAEDFDILITEIEFGNKIDISFIKELKSISPKSKVIVYTRFLNHAIRTRLLNDGADAFIFLRDISYLLGHIVKMIIKTIPNSKSINRLRN